MASIDSQVDDNNRGSGTGAELLPNYAENVLCIPSDARFARKSCTIFRFGLPFLARTTPAQKKKALLCRNLYAAVHIGTGIADRFLV